MARIQKGDSPGGVVLLLLVTINAIVLEQGCVAGAEWYAMLPVTLLLLLTAVIIFKSKLFP